MGLLNRLFASSESASSESIAKEMEADEESIQKQWNEYLNTLALKKELVGKLRPGSQLLANLQQLKQLLALELVDIGSEEREEKELVADLERIKHAEMIKRLNRLDACLRYVETKYEYVYKLLEQLYVALKTQAQLVELLLASQTNAEKLIAHIGSQFELEEAIINKIKQIETFHNLFLALARGEHIIRIMDAKEQKLLKRMQKGLAINLFSNELAEGVTYSWARAVFNQIEGKVSEVIANAIFPGFHEDIDFEYVNRPEFIDLVRQTIQSIRKRPVSEQMINVFVSLFREWYNHGRGGLGLV